METSKTQTVENSIVQNVLETAKRHACVVQAVYLYGSFGTAYFNRESDIDVGILFAEGMGSREWTLFYLDVASSSKYDLDCVNLLNANTVMQARVVSTGRKVYGNPGHGAEIGRFEDIVYMKYILLNEDRKPIVDQIKATGTVYG